MLIMYSGKDIPQQNMQAAISGLSRTAPYRAA